MRWSAIFGISLDSDYALRFVFALSHGTGWQSKQEIAKRVQLHTFQAEQAIARLQKTGLISEQDELCRLEREPETISVYDVIRAVEGEVYLNRCLAEDCYCSRDAADSCVIRAMYVGLQSSIVSALREKTMASLLADEGAIVSSD